MKNVLLFIQNKLKIIIWLVLLIILLSVSIFLFIGYRSSQAELATLQARYSITDESLLEVERKLEIIDELAKIYDVPSDETPSVAKVTNVDELKNEPFFAKAKNGDVVIVYQSIQKAILFDPLEKKILDVAEVSSSSAQQPKAEIPVETRVVVYNGTTISGKASAIAQQLLTAFPQIRITDTANAQNVGYEQTGVVILSETHQSVAQAIASELGAAIQTIPSGELVPSETDIVIIVGSDI
ncbi:MAG: LytR C-terminal domain-containing protein [Patescibacteria group bacterium]